LFQEELIDKTPLEIHEFYIEKFFILSSQYKVIKEDKPKKPSAVVSENVETIYNPYKHSVWSLEDPLVYELPVKQEKKRTYSFNKGRTRG